MVVIGSGPGGIQMSHSLTRLGIHHAAISADEEPGGMFRRYPLFQRLITWTKPFAPFPHDSAEFEWYDWNSLLGNEPSERASILEFMDGSSVFPSRAEMEAGLSKFTRISGVRFRFGCRWQATKVLDDGFIVETDGGDYRCQAIVLAVGMTDPWKPSNIEGIELAGHYSETLAPSSYSKKRVFVIGKGNSGFELADGLLPYVNQLILCSPRPARISINTFSLASARARYLQPYEDHIMGGGSVLVVDAQPTRIKPQEGGFRVEAHGTTYPGVMHYDVDEVIVATGFSAPLQDLPSHGLATFYRDGLLPAQTSYWESVNMPGIFFAGNITQGSIGLKKYGIPSSSGSVHGFRYNARVLAQHLAETKFGVEPHRPLLDPDRLERTIATWLTRQPELWNQQSYLARMITFTDEGATDTGIVPLAHFVDSTGPDAIAVAIETDSSGDIHPAIYTRSGGDVHEDLLPSSLTNDFNSEEHLAAIRMVLDRIIG